MFDIFKKVRRVKNTMFDADDFFALWLLLILVGGYSPYDAGVIVFKVIKYVVGLIWLPLLFTGLILIIMENKPVGGKEDIWWQEKKKTPTSPGITRFN